MRRSHIVYLKQMFESITSPPAPEGGYGPRFLEIHPSLDEISQNLPCVVIGDVKTRNSMPDKTKMDYIELPFRNEADGSMTVRRLRRNFLQDYTYRIQFYMNDPSAELLSDDAIRGVIDQCLIFLSENQRFVNDQQAVVRVESGESGMDTSMADEGIYMVYLDVVMHDAYYSIGENNKRKISAVQAGKAEVIQWKK